jgi:hypothetical protein
MRAIPFVLRDIAAKALRIACVTAAVQILDRHFCGTLDVTTKAQRAATFRIASDAATKFGRATTHTRTRE